MSEETSTQRSGSDKIKAEAVALRDLKRAGTAGDWHDMARREHKLAEACTGLLNGLLSEGGFTARVVFYWQDKRDAD